MSITWKMKNLRVSYRLLKNKTNRISKNIHKNKRRQKLKINFVITLTIYSLEKINNQKPIKKYTRQSVYIKLLTLVKLNLKTKNRIYYSSTFLDLKQF